MVAAPSLVAAVALRPVAHLQEIRQWPSQSGTCSLSPRVNSLVAPAAESSRTEAAHDQGGDLCQDQLRPRRARSALIGTGRTALAWPRAEDGQSSLSTSTTTSQLLSTRGKPAPSTSDCSTTSRLEGSTQLPSGWRTASSGKCSNWPSS